MNAILLHPCILVAVGGAFGSLVRYLLMVGVERLLGSGFPYAILAINIIGSFVIGLVSGLTRNQAIVALVNVGILGGFTTFSSFSLGTVNLFQNGRPAAASLYIMGSVGLCLLGTLFGLLLAGWMAAQRTD